ncbi:MAG: PfkB family carbohydrate kinase, partial [Planctomycetota bacterium]
CFGMRTGIVTAMVDNPVGELVQGQVRAMGVRPFYKRFAHDGVRGPNIATVYSDRGHGVRPPVVFYNRANEAAAMLSPGDIDWPAILGSGNASGGARWFHSGGIFAALGEKTSELVVEGMQAAHAAGAVTSYDLNYRAKLWKTLPGGSERGVEQNRQIARHTDVLIGNEEDLQRGLGLAGQDVEQSSALDPAAFFDMIAQVAQQFPNVKLVATTLREVHSTGRHSWSAVMWAADSSAGGEGSRYTCPVMQLDVLDRIGGGDGFASGLIYGLLTGADPGQALRLGWAHGALLTTYAGDVSQASLAEVEALAAGGSARVQR